MMRSGKPSDVNLSRFKCVSDAIVSRDVENKTYLSIRGRTITVPLGRYNIANIISCRLITIVLFIKNILKTFERVFEKTRNDNDSRLERTA